MAHFARFYLPWPRILFPLLVTFVLQGCSALEVRDAAMRPAPSSPRPAQAESAIALHKAPAVDLRLVADLLSPDAIPAIDNPQFESIDAAETWLQPQSPVLAVELDGEARAYPLAILTWHEIVNDVVGGGFENENGRGLLVAVTSLYVWL